MEFIGSTLGVKAITPDLAMGGDRKWDSLNQVHLVLALQGEYTVEISPDLVGELISVSAIIDFYRNEGLLQE